ncbi:MAG: O-antigen ligase family protein [Hyphomicrobium sp.]|nr:O-antigen ligase family protein [Hyphomicrobium sp.]
MTAAAISLRSLDAPRRNKRGVVAWLALAAVALTIATSGIVFTEPAPIDLLTIGLIVLLPVVGLVQFNPGLLAYGALWLVAGGCAMFAATFSLDTQQTMTHVGVTLYLYAATFVLAGFIAHSPRSHTELILKAWTVAALIAAAAGIVGYFGLLPGAHDLFTRYDRASGTFKDPNVFGPFIIVPMLYLLSSALDRPLRGVIMPLGVAGFLMLAVFLSFSRGAWINLFLSLVIYGYLLLATTSNVRLRLKIVGLLALGCVMAAGVIVAAASSDQIAEILSQRASLDQSYDTGSEGRFGGQEKAAGLVLENPLGIGAQEFAGRHHPEEAHNVYLTMLMSAGWLGGGTYLIIVALTLVLGLRHALTASATRPLFLVAYAAFAATAFEGMVIDTDHWRHFYVLLAVVWGLMTASAAAPAIARRAPRVLQPVKHVQITRRRAAIVGPATHPA